MTLAKYLSFDHKYAETVVVTDATRLAAGVAANRFVNRTGAYPAANGYAAGVSLYDIYGSYTLTGYPELTLTGTVTVTVTTGAVTGSGTAFTTELVVGAIVTIGLLSYRVVSIASNTAMVIETVGGASVPAVSAGATVVREELKGGYSVNGSSLNGNYEDRLNGSSTPYVPRVFPYQKQLTVITDGIAILEVDPASSAISLDSAIGVGTDGKAKLYASGVVAGRALDAVATPANGGFLRVKIGNVTGAS